MAGNENRLRVIILGAGVSASCGIPVAKDILRESMIVLADRNAKAAKNVHKLLTYLYPDFEETYRNYPNIEDFLNLIEMAQTFNSEEFMESGLWPPSRIEAVRATVLNAVTDYIWSFFANPKPAWPHVEAFFSKHVLPVDVIVTFNWDLTVERVFARLRPETPIAYKYSAATSRNGITLLKPHGSIDWFEKKATSDAHLAATRELDPKIRLVDLGTLLYSRDLIKATPVIVPPVSNKEFSRYLLFRETWGSIYRAISSATVLTVLGYSLPREDQFSRFVFRRALRNNIRRAKKGKKAPLEVIVVNPDESTEGTFARLVGRDATRFRFHRAYFEDFVDSLLL